MRPQATALKQLLQQLIDEEVIRPQFHGNVCFTSGLYVKVDDQLLEEFVANQESKTKQLFVGFCLFSDDKEESNQD